MEVCTRCRSNTSLTGETRSTEELGRGSDNGGLSDSGREVMRGRCGHGVKLHLGAVKLILRRKCRRVERPLAQNRKDMSVGYKNYIRRNKCQVVLYVGGHVRA